MDKISYRNCLYYLFINNFNICDYNDIKEFCKMMRVCSSFYIIIYPIIEHLIKFYQQEFELLGHKEAIKSKDMRIIRYLDSRYPPFKNYFTYQYIKIIIQNKFYELIDYLDLKNRYIVVLLNQLIKNNEYDLFTKYYIKIDDASTKLMNSSIKSGNINFVKTIYQQDAYYHKPIITAIINDQYESLEFFIKQPHDIFNYHHYAKNPKMYKYLVETIMKNNINPITVVHLAYIFVNDNNFELIDHILKYMNDINYEIFICHIKFNIYENNNIKPIHLIIEKIANLFNKNQLEIIDCLFPDIYYLYKYIKNIETYGYIIKYKPIKNYILANYLLINYGDIELFGYCANSDHEFDTKINLKKFHKLNDINYLKKLPNKKNIIKKILLDYKKYGYIYSYDTSSDESD